MLCLALRLNDDRYALDAAQVVEVLPLVHVRRLGQTHKDIAGIMLYRGAPIPVVDLSERLLGRPAHSRLSTRIIVVRRPDAGGRAQTFGLIAEGVTETLRASRPAGERVGCDAAAGGALPFLRRVSVDGHGLIQQLDLEALLPDPSDLTAMVVPS